uniref:Uncharacterized protein n=1 Tax=Mus musculus TaxID=10090 RepID=Q3UPH8_MOUSE|nr:unnamed protein product [Mus musculus]
MNKGLSSFLSSGKPEAVLVVLDHRYSLFHLTFQQREAYSPFLWQSQSGLQTQLLPCCLSGRAGSPQLDPLSSAENLCKDSLLSYAVSLFLSTQLSGKCLHWFSGSPSLDGYNVHLSLIKFGDFCS